MKTRFASALAAAAAALTLTTFAATPVAVWDGDFDATQTGYTLNLNDNTLSPDKSTITISQSVGVTVTKDEDTFSGGFTVLVRYSDLNTALADKQVLATSTLTDSNDRTGVTINKSGQSCGIWAGGSWNNSGTFNSMTSDQSSGVLAFMHYSTTSYSGVGTKLFSLGRYSAASTIIMNAGTLGSDNDKAKYKSFAIGGRSAAADGFSGATGMKISGIAVFSGILTEQEMLDYRWPTDVSISVDEDTSVSALNSQLTQATRAFLSVADGVELTLNEEFAIPVVISSEGSVSLSAASQPDASYFSSVDFSGVQGALLRSWLTPGVVGFNFNANGGRNGQGNTDGAADTALALEIGTWYKDAYSPSGSSTAMFADGLSLLTWQANNVYAEAGGLTDGTFIQGYLDDGGNVNIKLSAVPYETYDVIIYCSTDDSSKSFKAKTVNGTIYTWDSTAGETTTTSSDTATWGLASAAAGKAVYGANTLRINGLSGALSIKGGTNSDGARGCISAIQIMPAGTSTAPEMTVGTAGQTTQATWTGASWNVATAPTSGNVIINVSGDVELTIDETVALSAITVNGEGTLKIIPDQPNNVTFTASSISSAVPLIFANDGIGIATISAPVTYLYKTTSINSSTYGNTYTTGVGAQGSSVAISHNGGSVTLQGATYYLGESHNATATTVTFDDATAVYADCGVGMATYNVEGSSSITAQRLILSQGDSGRTAVMTVKDTASINVTGTSDVDSNQASIMFGHWNGPSTFTIQDSATFTAASQVLVGKTANNHTININGGTFTARGIKTAGYASGTNALNLNGGLLVLGDVGITSYGSTTIGVNVLDDSEIRASAATLPITQPVAISEGATLSFTKDSGVEGTVVTLEGVVSGAGDIVVGSGVTLNIGTNRPTAEMTINGSLNVVLADRAEIPVLKVSAEPADGSVFLYDTDGSTLVTSATVSYDAESGTITISSGTPRWSSSTDTVFDTVANWENSGGTVPSGGTIIIQVSDDTDITVNNDYSYDFISFYGNGQVQFTGNGSISVSQISIASGVMAVMKGSEGFAANSITGEGSLVLNPGSGQSITLAADNSGFTGALTIESGIVKMGNKLCLGARNRAAAITVRNGAVLDLNGTSHGGESGTTYNIILEEGATYANSVTIGDTKMFDVSGLTLLGDATVDASQANIGVTRHYHNPTTINLGEYTLTKIGANDMFLSQPTISGSGTFRVAAGTVRIPRYYYGDANAQPSVSGTLEVDVGAVVQLNTGYKSGVTNTVNNLVVNGEVKLDSTGEGAFRVTGSVSGTGTVSSPLILVSGATFKPTGTGYLTIADALIFDGKLTVDVSEIDMDKVASIPLFKVASLEMLPDAEDLVFSFGEFPKYWKLEKTADGLGYRLKKYPPFTIRFR